MKTTGQIVCSVIIVVGVVLLSAICWHSIEEIHYLKSFFPNTFSVEEAMFASIVELIKILIISLPIVVIVGIAAYCLRITRERGVS